MTRAPLLPPAVAGLWFAALLLWSAGLGVSALALPGGSSLTSVAIGLGAVGLAALYNRRGADRLDRTAAVATIIISTASALATMGVIALIVVGPDRPIGTLDVVSAATVTVTAAAAAASTSVLIRPYVDAFAAHIWAGIGGVGLGVPLMVAGVSPTFIMAAAVGLGIADRAHYARVARELEIRAQIEREMIERGQAQGRNIGVSGLPGLPLFVTAPTDTRPWSRRHRRTTIALGIAALTIVVVAWTAGILLAEQGVLRQGQGFAVASLGAAALLAQAVLLLRCWPELRIVTWACLGMLGAASAAIVASPADAVYFSALALQSVAVALVVGRLHHAVRGSGPAGAAMVATTAAIAWWIAIASTGGILLAFVAVVTVLLSLRRKVRS
ncbi:MAG: hypothetical protein RJQ01_04300 [Microcella sp.]|uniref:hypothetical protein n=1 Tax=Microcella sp. TaxID=1913979 RepID=UPI0033147A68